MKRIALLFGALLAVAVAHAQISIKVTEANESFNNGSHNALLVTVYEQDAKEVEKLLKKELKDMGGKVQVKKEIFADDCETKAMGENTFDVYAKVTPGKNGEVEVAVAVDLGGAYLNSRDHTERYKVMEGILHKFGVNATRDAIGSELKDQEKVLSDLEKEQKDLEKDKDRLEKSIEDNEKRIEEAKKAIEQAKKDIEQNKADQEMKKSAIADQQGKVADVQKKMDAVK